jgi:Cu-Zn family superoxide dismutase
LEIILRGKEHPMKKWYWAVIPAAALLLTAACNQNKSENQVPAEQPQAVAESHEHADQGKDEGEEMSGFAVALAPTKGSSATGTVMAMSMGGGVHFSGVIAGLTPGPHGVHIHEKGDCSAPDGSSAGGHFNPKSANHGAPDRIPHHAGDLGNIVAGADGRAELNVHDADVTLEPGDASVNGRAIIVHAGPDDFKSQPAGNSGERVACGVLQGAF